MQPPPSTAPPPPPPPRSLPPSPEVGRALSLHSYPLQIHRLAARCIQKNVAVFLTVRDWPWWRLLGSLRPLLSATIGEEQLRTKEVGPRGGRGDPPHSPTHSSPLPSVCIQTSTPSPGYSSSRNAPPPALISPLQTSLCASWHSLPPPSTQLLSRRVGAGQRQALYLGRGSVCSHSFQRGSVGESMSRFFLCLSEDTPLTLPSTPLAPA